MTCSTLAWRRWLMETNAKIAGRRDRDLSARFSLGERQRVERAVAKSGKSMSDFIREAVISSADEVLADESAATAFADAIGVISVKGAFGRRADATYASMLTEKHRRRPRRQNGQQAAPDPDLQQGS